MLRPVRVECRKWPDDPHWEFDGLRLGVDGHGTWIGITQGTLLASPSRAFQAAADHVTLVPHDAWWLATFYADDPRRPFDTYVDMATPAVWHGEDLVRAVDLDLDVIRGTTGRVWVDDEDEFAEHRVSLGYPDDVIDGAVASSQEILRAVQEGTAPFDGSHRYWVDRLRARWGADLSSPD
jgi:predicted RNA-binding protein associated with RNAse of E/G family